MPGLEPNIVASFSKDRAIGRLLSDIRTDFIFAPQYKLVFERVADDLWEQLIKQLRSGSYNPSPLITAEVPKESGMSRPGSILYPADRLLYQLSADYLAPLVDSQLESSSVYSYRILDPDPTWQMYQPRSESYERFKAAVTKNSSDGRFTHALVADISSYFVHLNHHTLENLLTESMAPEGLVKLLVKSMLETWSGRFSYGIPQGMFPSDLLGNFYLSALDTFLASQGILSLRYVDDLVLFYKSGTAARVSLAPLCRFLRSIGLDLNESKSHIVTVHELDQEQTELDKLFENARQERLAHLQELDDAASYGFQDLWDEPAQMDQPGGGVELLAVGQLWEQRNSLNHPKRDQLDRFCLGAFAAAGSDSAVDVVLQELGQRPHQTRTNCNYLATFASGSQETERALCAFIQSDKCVYDWELQWPIAALLPLNTLVAGNTTVNKAMNILTDPRRSNELRSACAVLIGKFGNGAAKTNLRSHWDSENSEHVRAAMVLATTFFGSAERNTLLNHWGNQSPLYGLIAKAVRKQLSMPAQG